MVRKYVKQLVDILEKMYPNADCTLDYKTPFELLIATQLAAQCTDARVNIVMKDLTKKYPNVEAFANADLEELMQDVRSTGFYRNKAKNIILTSQRLIEVYGGEVPNNMEDLLTLCGVGRKTANLVLGDVFGVGGVVVDTHCGRIARRFGLTENVQPYKVEQDLEKLLPRELQSDFCHRIVMLGREFCTSRKAKCDMCDLNLVCKKII